MSEQTAAAEAAGDEVGGLVRWLEGLGAPDHALDEMVYEVKGREAADINNSGGEAQAEYLAGAEGTGEGPGDDVHDLKGAEASEINNSGFGGQLSFLLAAYGGDAAALRAAVLEQADLAA